MLRFSHTVALISAFVALFSVLFLSAVLYNYFALELKSEIEVRNELVARSMSGQVSSELNLPVEVLSILADQVNVSDPVMNTEALLDRKIEKHSFFEAIFLLDREGNDAALGTLPELSMYKEELRNTSMVFQPFFTEVVGQEKLYWSQVISSPITGAPSLTLSMDTGNGVIVGYINLRWLEDIARGLEQSGKVDIRFIDSNGVLLRDPDQDKVWQRINVANIPIVQLALTGEERTGQFDYFGETMLGSTVSIPSTQWVLVVSQGYEQAIAPLSALLRIAIYSAIFSVTGGILLALFLSRTGTRSIVRLSGDVRRIASGDYLFKPAAGGYIETRDLSLDVQDLAASISQRETELKKAEEQLRKINEELEARVESRTAELLESQAALSHTEELLELLEASPIAVGIVRNKDGKIVFTNTRSAEMLGFSRDEMLKSGIDQSWLSSGEWARLQGIFQQKGAIDNEEFRFSTASGEELWGLLTWSHVELAGERCSLYWVYDVTGLKNIESALIEARVEAETATRAKSDFLANMSHEIRTPMTAVIGLNNLMELTKLDQRQQEYLEKIQNASAHLLSVINDILDFSKLDSGRMRLESLSFRIDEVLDKACDIVRLQAEKKGVDVLVCHDWDMPVDVFGDPVRLGQLLINLVNNAIKFTDRGSVIIEVEKISEANNHAKYQFSISDTGIGMDEQQQKEIFHSFSQADSSITRKFGGTGLGLAISKQLAEVMGGDITVSSKRGEGSVFQFQVQLEISADVVSQQKVKYLAHNYRVMLVDDNPVSNKILQRILLQFGAGVIAFDQHEFALQALLDGEQNNTPFQLLILDCHLLERKGIEFLRKLRSHAELLSLPVVLLVGSKSQPEILEGAIAATLNEILLKPVSPATLFNSVASALGEKPRLPRRLFSNTATGDFLKDIAGARTLVVEDTHINQQIIRELLESNGLVVTLASNGQEALNELAQGSFDIVLMDIQMPVLDGYEATRRIRSNPEWADLPIIAMTAHTQESDIARCEQAGMNGHLAKPIDRELLFRMLGKWVDSVEVLAVNEKNNIVSDEEYLPEDMPGVDLTDALHRVSGNRSLLGKLLREFYLGYRDTGSKLQQLLANDNKSKAMQLLHMLKGAAGNLGVSQVSQYAERLMQGWDQEADKEELFARLLTAMNEVNRGLATYTEAYRSAYACQADTENEVIGQFDASLSFSLLQDLDVLVKQRNSRARSLLDDLAVAFAGEYQAQFALLQDQVTNYDYNMAGDTIVMLFDLLQKTNARGEHE